MVSPICCVCVGAGPAAQCAAQQRDDGVRHHGCRQNVSDAACGLAGDGSCQVAADCSRSRLLQHTGTKHLLLPFDRHRYTIEGTKDAPGVMPRALVDLFAGLAAHVEPLVARASYYEVGRAGRQSGWITRAFCWEAGRRHDYDSGRRAWSLHACLLCGGFSHRPPPSRLPRPSLPSPCCRCTMSRSTTCWTSMGWGRWASVPPFG